MSKPSEKSSQLAQIAALADARAMALVLSEYRGGLASSTVRHQRRDLALFETFLADSGAEVTGLAEDLALWTDLSFGLVKAFVNWQLDQGYRIGSINLRLSTVRTYARLAAMAGYLSVEQAGRIALIRDISQREGRNLDERRERTSMGAKKSQPTPITPAQVALAKRTLAVQTEDGDTLASRDLLLWCLLSDHGLRCSEVSALTRGSLDLARGHLLISRPKADDWLRHQLTPSTLYAAERYVKLCAIEEALFAGEAPGSALAPRSIFGRVSVLGKLAGISDLSPHDLRHYYATYSRGSIGALQQAGGWSSPEMPLKYRVEQRIANEGVFVPGQPGWDQAR